MATLALHKNVYEKLLCQLEKLVEAYLKAKKLGEVSSYNSTSGEIWQVKNRTAYFGVAKHKNVQNAFGKVLEDLMEDLGDNEKYSRRQLYDAYATYRPYSKRKPGSLWAEISREYVERYLRLLNEKRELMGDEKEWNWERLLEESGLEGEALNEQKEYWDGPQEEQEAEIRYYLLSYVSWGEKHKRLKYALMEFSVVPGEKNECGEVKVSKTSSGSDYRGEYELLRQGQKFSEDVLKITLQSGRRPLFILINKKKEKSFAHFQFLIANFVFIDTEFKNVQGSVLLERLKGVKPEELEQLEHGDLEDLSSLKEYDKLLLLDHLSYLNQTDVLPESAFENLTKLRDGMKELHAWWSEHSEVLDKFFADGQDEKYFYLYFFGKREKPGDDSRQKNGEIKIEIEKYLVRYPLSLKKTGEVQIWGAGGRLRYKGVYRAELKDALSMKVESPSSVDKPNYFHMFFRKREDGSLQGLYAGWVRKTSGLELFSGEIVAVPVKRGEWNRKKGKLFSLEPDMTKIEEPEWRREIVRHDVILGHLAGFKSRSAGNGLAFLPGVLPVYERGALHSDLKDLAGVYYYYRTRTRPGRQYTVKAYAILIDEQGGVYVKSRKDNKTSGKKKKVELLYRGTLVRVNRKHGKEWSVIAVLEKTEGDFGGILIIERPELTPGLGLQYAMRGIHLSLNYFGDPIAGRVYFMRESEKANWRKFKKMQSPKYFVQHYDKDKGTLHWHVSKDLKGDVEEIGKRVKDEALLRVLNRLCGQVNNFLAFRNRELEVRTNVPINIAESPLDKNFYFALFNKGSYAEDVLRAALAYWREGDKIRFQEAFFTAIICGGYSDIPQLRKLFVENKEFKASELKSMKEALEDIRNQVGSSEMIILRAEKKAFRIKFILKQMFEDLK